MAASCFYLPSVSLRVCFCPDSSLPEEVSKIGEEQNSSGLLSDPLETLRVSRCCFQFDIVFIDSDNQIWSAVQPNVKQGYHIRMKRD